MLQVLPWDSAQLQLKVGRLDATVQTLTVLEDCLAQARRQDLQLLYWQIPATQSSSIKLAQRIGAQLTDHKITYFRQIDKKLINPFTPATCYIQFPPETDLLELAYASGEYSRFRQDVRLTVQQFQTIYQTWLHNSINRSIAEAVLVIQNAGKLAGMVTVGEKQQRGDIGLLAVTAQQRGRGIGQQLINAAMQHFWQRGHQTVQVVTQQQNIPACHLYEKMGFTIDTIDYFYHVWI